ncbi:hypothetical protein [Streptomyces sp. DSM 40907]|uniref:hypothetical protein n=1 Tax=Streptomyces kutzneri TaxID=3051179 RepID=UPI0028D05856|nr:hypothetical protein [Streptomyces sp. DSM 40907]
MLFAHGGRFGGHALFVRDNRLHCAYNFLGTDHQPITASRELPTGEKLILAAAFEKDGEVSPGVASGVLSLYHGDRKVGEGRIKTQPGRFTLAGEGLTVGRDSGEAVTDHYPGAAPWAFTGATLHRVAVDVSGEPYIDLETEAQAMLARE